MDIKTSDNGVVISGFGKINLDVTLDCGQAFRWEKTDGLWRSVVKNTEVAIRSKENELEFIGIDENLFNTVFYPYFDFDRDYEKILRSFGDDGLLKDTVEHYGTIRILNQEPWETLCSFIISSCNNIPRIKGIINRLCENFGEKCDSLYSFPSAEKISALTPGDLDVLRAGYRAEYILDAAKKVSTGEVDLESLKNTDIDTARKELMKIKGTGRKVADCTLLFGLGFIESFPVDRHIKRICEENYPDGLPGCIKGYEGIAQQYMFHFQRNSSKK